MSMTSIKLTSVFSSASARVTSRLPSLQGEQSSTTEIHVMYEYSGNFRLNRILTATNLRIIIEKMCSYIVFLHICNFWTLHCKMWRSRHTCAPQSNIEKSRLRRICTYHLKGVTYLCKYSTRLYTLHSTKYKVDWTPSTYQLIHCHPKDNLHPFSCRSADHSQPHSDSFGNFLRPIDP